MPSTKIVITAIVCLTLLEAVALWRGIDGVLFSLVVAGISGLGGFKLKEKLGRK